METGLTAAQSIVNDDYFRITGTCDDVADEYVHYSKDITNISSDVYTKWLARYRTSAASNGLGCKIMLYFAAPYDGSPQTLVGSAFPAFSQTWKVETGTITPSRTIDLVHIVADDYPNSVASGTYTVDVDFILLYKNDFTWPNVTGGCELILPNRNAVIEIPGRVTDISQYLGAESAQVHIWGDINAEDAWKRVGDTLYGEVFYDIAHNAYQEPCQWLDTGETKFKVVMDKPVITEPANDPAYKQYDLLFKEYRRSSGSNETYAERFGIGT